MRAILPAEMTGVQTPSRVRAGRDNHDHMNNGGIAWFAGNPVVANLTTVLQQSRHEFESAGLHLAIREAGSNRFRPILLMSLTTFLGLAPLMLEHSIQAAFLVPMAVSPAFGVLFVTLMTLIRGPVSCLILGSPVLPLVLPPCLLGSYSCRGELSIPRAGLPPAG